MASFLALDYGAQRVRLMEFDGSVRKLRVLKVVDVDLHVAAASGDDDDEMEAADLKAELVATAVDEAGFTLDPSMMSFDAGSALFREFDLPFTSDDQIQKVVRFEAESHIPIDIEDVALHHQVLRKTREKSHILTAAVRKDELLERLDILEAANIDPHQVDIDVFALFNALKATGVAEEAGVQVVVDAREDATSVLFLVDGSLFAVRQLRLGVHGILSDADATAEQAEGASERMESEAAQARGHDYTNRLKRELRRTLTTLPNLGSVDRVQVTGAGQRVEGLLATLTEVFGTDAQTLDLLAQVDHKLSREEVERFGPDIGVALGVAYKLLGADELRADFRQDECAYTRKFDQVKTPLIFLAFLVFLAVALLGVEAYKKRETQQDDYVTLIKHAKAQLQYIEEKTDEEVAAVYENAKTPPQKVAAIHGRVDDIREELEQQLGRGEKIPPLPSSLAAWIEFSDLVMRHEEPLGRFWVDKLHFSLMSKTPTMKISGIMESAGKYNDLINLFEDDPLYRDVQPGGTSPTDDGFTAFTEVTVELDLEVLESRGLKRQGPRSL